MEYLYAMSFRNGKNFATTTAGSWVEAAERAMEYGHDLALLSRGERVPLHWASNLAEEEVQS